MKHKELRNLWKLMGEARQAQEIARMDIKAEEHGAETCHERWPVSEEALDAFIFQNSSTAGIAGLASKGLTIRQEGKGNLIVTDDSQLISPDKVFEHILSCSQLHPGLCQHKDAHVYEKSLTLAKSLERLLDKSFLHRLFLIATYWARRRSCKLPGGKSWRISRSRRRALTNIADSVAKSGAFTCRDTQ